MKELSIEQKAQRYDEAIERAKKVLLDCTQEEQKVVEYITPELKESEWEKIRKGIIRVIKGNMPDNDFRKKYIAWLEKQGEMDMESYKIAEDEKREFVGHGFVKCYANFQDFKEMETYWLEYVGNDNYNVRSDNLLGKTYHITPCQLYTIFKKLTWLEKQGEQKPAENKGMNLVEEEMTPFQKKVFCIIDTTIEEEQGLKQVCDELLRLAHDEIMQSTAWSEEDIMRIDNLIAIIENKGYPDYVEYLEKLKERVFPQPKQEWSEEDYNEIETIACHLDNINNEGMAEMLRNIRDKYYHIIPQSTWKPSDEHYELEEFAKIVRGNLTGISKAVQELFEAKYLQLTGNKMYGGYKD